MSQRSWLLGSTGVLIAAVVTRFAGLGQRFFHHDEAIHAWLANAIVRGNGYHYDPVYHGPLLYHLETAVFRLLGTGDVQARLVSAACGVMLVGLLVTLLRRHLGQATALTAGALAVLSPSLTYYSRFNSHDALIATLTVVMLTTPFEHQRSGMVWFAGAAALAVATKLNAYFVLGTLALYVVGRAAYGAVRGRPLAGMHAFLRDVSYVALTAGVAAFLLALMSASTFVHYVRAAQLPVFEAVVKTADSMLFDGFRYWWAAHETGRLGGPFYFYLVILGIYEPIVLLGAPLSLVYYMQQRWRFAAVVLALAATAWSVAGGNVALASAWLLAGAWTVVSLWNARRDFLACWVCAGVCQLLLYSYANEKVPWLAVHILLPWLVVVAACLHDLWTAPWRFHLRPGFAVRLAFVPRPGFVLRPAFAALVIVLVLVTARSSWIVNTRNRSDVAEPLVQVDYADEVARVVQQVASLADVSGGQLRIAIEPSLQWPFAWYFRDLHVEYLDGPAQPDVTADVLLTQDQPLSSVLAQRFRGERLRYHHWTTWTDNVRDGDVRGMLRFMIRRDRWGRENGAFLVVWTPVR